NVKEAGQISWDDSMPGPTLLLPDAEKERVLSSIKKMIASQEQKISKIEGEGEAGFQQWLSKGEYKKLSTYKIPMDGLQAHFTFDKGDLKNETDHKAAVMKRDSGQPGDAPVFTAGSSGKGLALNGDTWLDLNQVGVFRKSEPFSIGIWL